jgi:nucleoredoxin
MMKKLLLLAALVPTLAFASLDDLFGPSLVDSAGKRVATSTLDGKIVGIYFSAHWCPPCRAFSPELVKFRNANQKDFDVVFVSSDRTEAAQFGYMKDVKMDWPAVPFGSPIIRKLAEKYNVEGIPTLIIVDSKGNLITENGRADVTNNPETALAGWKKSAKN